MAFRKTRIPDKDLISIVNKSLHTLVEVQIRIPEEKKSIKLKGILEYFNRDLGIHLTVEDNNPLHSIPKYFLFMGHHSGIESIHANHWRYENKEVPRIYTKERFPTKDSFLNNEEIKKIDSHGMFYYK